MTTGITPDPHAVAEWRRSIQVDVGCVRRVPDETDPRDVAAYNEAVRQLQAEANAEPEVP